MTVSETAKRTLPESIANLDLQYLGRKLLDNDASEAERRDGERLWDEARVERALYEYRQFLALMLWHPEAFIVPSEDIDEVWHAHVLHTARYEADCEAIFGRFQHHAPAGGEESGEEQDELLQGRDETLQLFAGAFGEVPPSYGASDYRKCGRADEAPKCGRSAARCGRVAKCGRVVAKCGRTSDYRKCGRTTAKCGRIAKCGRAAKCGRMARCGRVVAKCGRTAAKCGRT